MRLALTLFLALFILQAAGEDARTWEEIAFKKENPNELAYRMTVDSACQNTITQEKAESIVEGVFVRSRIKPLGETAFAAEPIFLNLRLRCHKFSDELVAASIQAMFGSYAKAVPVLYDITYGSTGIVGEELLQEAVRNTTEQAITEYLKANFDLGE